MKDCNIKTQAMISIFPSGDYKMYLNFTRGNGDFYAAVNLVTTLISTNKDTFG